MAREHAERFHARRSQDPELRDKVAAASARILDIARDQGLDFTREELSKVFKGRLDENADSDDGTDRTNLLVSERSGR